MKKLITKERWKKHLARRVRSQADARRLRAATVQGRHRGASYTSQLQAKGTHPPVTIVAPEVLSMVEEPNETVRFLERIRSEAKYSNIFIDLGPVKRLTPDAISSVVATLQEERIRNRTKVTGRYPEAPEAREVLMRSGFGEHVILPRTQDVAPEPGGKMSRLEKLREGKLAHGDFAGELIDFARGHHRHGVGLKACYTVLLECMSNTFQHASLSKAEYVKGQLGKRKNWWATVYYEPSRKVTCFTFLDLGVGILESVELKRRLLLIEQVFGGQKEILRRLLNRDIPSRTGLPYRGRGLPSVGEACREGRISRLIIVANNAFGDVERDGFRNLDVPFRGTLLYWEVRDGSGASAEVGSSEGVQSEAGAEVED